MQNKEPLPKRKKALGSSYLKYSGLAVQIVATILLLGYLGKSLDARVQNERPYFTLLFACIGLVGSMIYLIRRVGGQK